MDRFKSVFIPLLRLLLLILDGVKPEGLTSNNRQSGQMSIPRRRLQAGQIVIMISCTTCLLSVSKVGL